MLTLHFRSPICKLSTLFLPAPPLRARSWNRQNPQSLLSAQAPKRDGSSPCPSPPHSPPSPCTTYPSTERQGTEQDKTAIHPKRQTTGAQASCCASSASPRRQASACLLFVSSCRLRVALSHSSLWRRVQLPKPELWFFGRLLRCCLVPGTPNLQISPPSQPSNQASTPTLMDMHLSQNTSAC